LKGDRPTNPLLLDWLSREFMTNGWHVKSLHRLILNSRVYQLSSVYREAPGQFDPANRLLWRFPRERLPGEVIRDAALAVAGLLNPKMGGPSVFPELPVGMPTPRGGWKVSEDVFERNRRSVYVFVRRNTRYPMFDSFDMPDPHESCARRSITTSPLQALTLFNGRPTREWARGMAKRVVCAAGPDEGRQVEQAFRLAFGRSPDASEARMAHSFFKEHAQVLAKAGQDQSQDLPSAPTTSQGASSEGAPNTVLVDFCHTLLNANEFVYRN
jgi:hypothetical protein